MIFLRPNSKKEWVEYLNPFSERHHLTKIYEIFYCDDASNTDIPDNAKHHLSKIKDLDRRHWPRENEQTLCEKPWDTLCPLVAAMMFYDSPDILDILVKDFGFNVNSTWMIQDYQCSCPSKEYNALTFLLSEHGGVALRNCKIRRLINLGIDTTTIVNFNLRDEDTYEFGLVMPRYAIYFKCKIGNTTRI